MGVFSDFFDPFRKHHKKKRNPSNPFPDLPSFHEPGDPPSLNSWLEDHLGDDGVPGDTDGCDWGDGGDGCDGGGGE